jgi:hypothetical protein
MIINTRTTKGMPLDTVFVNVEATYAYHGDRLLWDSMKEATLEDILYYRDSHASHGRRNLRWDGDLKRPEEGSKAYE